MSGWLGANFSSQLDSLKSQVSLNLLLGVFSQFKYLNVSRSQA